MTLRYRHYYSCQPSHFISTKGFRRQKIDFLPNNFKSARCNSCFLWARDCRVLNQTQECDKFLWTRGALCYFQPLDTVNKNKIFKLFTTNNNHVFHTQPGIFKFLNALLFNCHTFTFILLIKSIL